jgi:uncharacterized membrane protein (TIGR02234 family)
VSAPARPRRRSRLEFAAVVGLDLVAAAVVLLLCTRTWQTVRLARPRPLRDEVLRVTGRTVTEAPTAFALVALAGVVAVLASRGLARRVIGLVLVGAGAAIAVSATSGWHRLSAGRIRALAESKNVVGLGAPDTWRVAVHPAWAAGCVVAGAAVALAGALVCVRGGRWGAMSARYAAPAAARTGQPSQRGIGPGDPGDAAGDDARAQASLWSALERGDDPTAEHAGDGA